MLLSTYIQNSSQDVEMLIETSALGEDQFSLVRSHHSHPQAVVVDSWCFSWQWILIPTSVWISAWRSNSNQVNWAHPVLLMWFLGLDAVFLGDSSPMEHPCPVGHGCQETHHARRGLQPALVTSVPGAVDKMPWESDPCLCHRQVQGLSFYESPLEAIWLNNQYQSKKSQVHIARCSLECGCQVVWNILEL